VRQCGVQVLDWQLPMEAGQYQVYADALFGAAADALLAPPMQVPQILVPWEPPDEPKQGARAQPPAHQNTSATESTLPPPSQDPEHVQL